MVISCVAYGCCNEQDGRKIPFHTFPFKRPEILTLWINAIRRENWTPTKTSRLCGKHFLPRDYVVRPGLTQKLLKPDAVPSVFSFPECLSSKPKLILSRRKLLKQVLSTTHKREDELMDIDSDVDIPSTRADMGIRTIFTDTEILSTSVSPKTSSASADKGSQTCSDQKTAMLRRKIKTLRQKVRRRNVKIQNMKDVISSIQKKWP